MKNLLYIKVTFLVCLWGQIFSITSKLSVNVFTPFHVVNSLKFWKIIKNFETELFILSENSICKFLENALMLT